MEHAKLASKKERNLDEYTSKPITDYEYFDRYDEE